jgi:Cu(I)/Ag(I) efflux system periplasmic protein CusF
MTLKIDLTMNKRFFSIALVTALITASTLAHSETQLVNAIVVQVDVLSARIVLDHDAIKEIEMPAMVMPYRVEPTVNLKKFKKGDQVLFSLKSIEHGYTVEKLINSNPLPKP